MEGLHIKNRKPGILLPGLMAIVLALGAALSCHRDFESPYLPGSKDYVGDEWSQDTNHDGIADSVQKYVPDCELAPQLCVDQARVLSKLQGVPSSISATDMILWMGDPASLPRLNWTPSEAAGLGYILLSSDSSKVLPHEGRLEARAVGNAQITVKVNGNESMGAAFIAKVYDTGKKVVSVTAKDVTLLVNADTLPELSWEPVDARVKEYSLQSDKPGIARIVGQKVRGIASGVATVTLETADGAKKTAFKVNVVPRPDFFYTDSLVGEEMFLVVGTDSVAPLLHWYPGNASDQRYNLLSMDDNIAALNGKKDQIIPKGTGSTIVYALSLDGGGKACSFQVNVSTEAMAVKGITAVDLNLVVGTAPQLPKLTWLPTDATNRKYSLVSSRPEVAEVQGGMILPVSMGTANFVVTTQEGGFQNTFRVTVGQADSAIHVDSVRVQNLFIPEGGDEKPIVSWFPTNAGNRAYTLASEQMDIAIPNGDLIHGVKSGTTNITLTTVDGLRSSSFQVIVYVPQIPVLSIQADSMSLLVGDAGQRPNLIWTPSNATDKYYSMSSVDNLVASISADTLVVGNSVGSTKIQVTTRNGLSTSFMAVVYANAIPVRSVAVGKMTLNMGDAGASPPDIVWKPANATNKNYTLSAAVGSPLVATIQSNKIVPANPGKAIVTLISQENPNVTAQCTVTVVSLVRAIVVPDDTLRLGSAGKDIASHLLWDPVNPSSKGFSLKSNDETIVTTSGSMIIPVKAGKTSVIVTASDGSLKAATFNVLVKVPVRSVAADDVTLPVSDALFNPFGLFTWTPAEATDKNWKLVYPGSTSPTSIVKIVNNEQLQAVGPGSAYVTVVSNDSSAVRDTFLVTVTVPAGGVAAANMSVGVGQDAPPVLSWTPTTTTDKGYTLSGGNPATAIVAGQSVHGVAVGTATFTVTSTADPTKTATFTATVTQPVVSITAADLTMTLGDADRDPSITWNPTKATVKTYGLTSLKTSVVTINGGKIHAIASGTASVVVNTTDGNKLDTFSVVVGVPVTSISVAKLTLKKGEDKAPVLTWNPTNTTNKDFTLSGYSNAIVSVLDGNIIHGLAAGSTTMIATTTMGNKSATFTVSVTVPVQGIKADNLSMSQFDQDTDPVLTWTPADATNKEYTLSVGNGGGWLNAVIIVNGKIRPYNRGTADVTVTTADGGFTDTFTVTVGF